jgi:hypothetical protein
MLAARNIETLTPRFIICFALGSHRFPLVLVRFSWDFQKKYYFPFQGVFEGQEI